jgi:hypothetical protein
MIGELSEDKVKFPSRSSKSQILSQDTDEKQESRLVNKIIDKSESSRKHSHVVEEEVECHRS